MTMPSRCFLGLGLPADAADALASYATLIEQRCFQGARLRRVDVRDLHLTLRFLGAVDEACLPQLVEGTGSIAADFGPLACRLSGVAMWPNVSMPRVLVAGVRCDGPLEDIAARCETLAQALCLPAERRRFRAHITLARFPANAPPVRGNLIPPPELRFRTDALQLMESLQRPGLPRYRVLAHAQLSAEA
jgi:RNA 2',3'-cyclic 3'-phosphodiesterase